MTAIVEVILAPKSPMKPQISLLPLVHCLVLVLYIKEIWRCTVSEIVTMLKTMQFQKRKPGFRISIANTNEEYKLNEFWSIFIHCNERSKNFRPYIAIYWWYLEEKKRNKEIPRLTQFFSARIISVTSHHLLIEF